MCLLRKLDSLGVSQQISELVHKQLVESVLAFHFPALYGHLHCGNKTKLRKFVSMANKIVEMLTQLHAEKSEEHPGR